MNYVPFMGPLVATVFPTLFAMTQFGSWQAVIAVFACLNLIQFIVGSYIEPRVAGSALSISPPIVLFSVFFWSYLWGVFGAFIGVPITIALITFCALHPSSRWLAETDRRGAEGGRSAGGWIRPRLTAAGRSSWPPGRMGRGAQARETPG